MVIRIEGSTVVGFFNAALDSKEFQDWATEFKLKTQNTQDEIEEFGKALPTAGLSSIQQVLIDAYAPFDHLTTHDRLALKTRGNLSFASLKRTQQTSYRAKQVIAAALPDSPVVQTWENRPRTLRALAAKTKLEPTELAIAYLTSPHSPHGPMSISDLSATLFPNQDLEFAKSRTNVQIMKLRQALAEGVSLVTGKEALRWERT